VPTEFCGFQPAHVLAADTPALRAGVAKNAKQLGEFSVGSGRSRTPAGGLHAVSGSGAK